jgi:hypothetical protein
MVRKVIAGLLFFYALWQIVTCLNAPSQGQVIGQIVWAIVAVGGGVYLWKQSNKSKV